MEYRKRVDGSYVPVKVTLGNGKKCEILTIHDRTWVDAITIYGPGADNKAWVMESNGQCRSADISKYKDGELVLKWHGGETLTYKYDSTWDMYRRVPAAGKDGFVANLEWDDGVKTFLFSENNVCRACSRIHSFSGYVMKRTNDSFTIRWDASKDVETFVKQSDGSYKIKQ